MLWGCSNLVWGLPRSPGHTSGEGVVSPDIHLEGERVGGRRDVLTRYSFIELWIYGEQRMYIQLQ